MLQQTRVETVIDYWFKWMNALPNIQELSKAPPDAVNTLWSGLGYYSRAQRLREGAQKVVQEHNGELPDTAAKLLEIPGIGPYTAGAISSIAYNKNEPLVDGNVIRVVTRLRGIKNEINPSVEKRIWDIARSLVDPQEPGNSLTQTHVQT
jgi:A/G-specific adenine glycosylase